MKIIRKSLLLTLFVATILTACGAPAAETPAPGAGGTPGPTSPPSLVNLPTETLQPDDPKPVLIAGPGTPTAVPYLMEPEDLAREAARAFLTINYQEPVETWLYNICWYALEACENFEKLAPQIYSRAQKQQLNNVAVAQKVEKLEDKSGGQIWKVNLLVNGDKKETMYIFIVNEKSRWRVGAVLTRAEYFKRFGTPTPKP